MTEPRPKSQRDAQGRLLPGNSASTKHGVTHYMTTGKLPSIAGRRALNQYLKSLEKDLNETTGEANVKKELMIKQVVRTEGVMRLIEIYLQKFGPMNPHKLRQGKLELQHVLSASYLTTMNTQRQAILALGLEIKPKGELTLADIIKEYDTKTDAEAAASVGEAGDPGSSEDSSGAVPGGGVVKSEGEDQGNGIN